MLSMMECDGMFILGPLGRAADLYAESEAGFDHKTGRRSCI